MGQAKLRGNKEQRVAEGIAKREAEEAAREARKRERWRKMTPKQRAMEMELAALMAFADSTMLGMTRRRNA